MKKIFKLITILLLLIILCFLIIGCANRPKYGTYINENNPDSMVMITEDYIKCINVDFTQLNQEIKRDFNIDLMLNEQMNKERSYTYEKGKIIVDIMTGLALSFEYSNKKIDIMQIEYKLRES